MKRNERRSGCRSHAARAAGLAIAGLLCAVSSGQAQSRDVPPLDAAARAQLERLVRSRGFTRGLPRDPMPSPDGKRVYYLQSGPDDSRQILYVLDLDGSPPRPLLSRDITGDDAPAPSAAEQARRERQRQTERGVTSFQVSDDGARVLVPYAGDLFLVDPAARKTVRLTETEAPEIDAQLSPDRKWVAFVRGDDLLTLEIATGRERVVAHSDVPGISYGSAEFIAQEEMDRQHGFWWSDDSRWLAYMAVDTRGVPSFAVPNFHDARGEGSAGPYPKAGDPNALTQLYVAALDGSAPKQLDLGADVEYVARVHWSPQSNAVWVETQPRSQKRLDLRRIDVATGASRLVQRETAPDWVNLHDEFRFLQKGARFLWASERSGHRHLEVIAADGGTPQPLTSGAWDVVHVLDVDETHGTVTFTGTRDGVTEQHLYRVPLGGGAVERLSREPGWHDAQFHPRGHDLWVETWSDERTPPQNRVMRRGTRAGELHSAAWSPTAADLGPKPQALHFDAPGGAPLDVRLTLPERSSPTAPLPLVVYVYGGPGAQQVQRRWPGERGLFEAWLAARGFAVARIDGRGVAARGHESERVFAGRLGDGELADQVAGVRALLQRFPELDPMRVGIWGWSYGGYMTLMALMRAPDVFQAGVAVAPVVDWTGYDTHYTERYLGLPAEHAAAYDSSSVLQWTSGLRGHLTLVHGTSDDNVHFRQSMQLVDRLVEETRRFDLMVYPGTHMMETLPERVHLYDLVYRTFASHL